MLFVVCMDKGLSEEVKENRWRKRRGLPPKPVKKALNAVPLLWLLKYYPPPGFDRSKRHKRFDLRIFIHTFVN